MRCFHLFQFLTILLLFFFFPICSLGSSDDVLVFNYFLSLKYVICARGSNLAKSYPYGVQNLRDSFYLYLTLPNLNKHQTKICLWKFGGGSLPLLKGTSGEIKTQNLKQVRFLRYFYKNSKIFFLQQLFSIVKIIDFTGRSF